MKLNWKNVIISTIALAMTWQLMDWVIHGKILMEEYQATANLWRPMDQMKGWAMIVAGIGAAFSFAAIYDLGFAGKGRTAALWYGGIFGFGFGISMGVGSFGYMAITNKTMMGWMFGTWAECLVGGFVVWQVYEFLGKSKKSGATKKAKTTKKKR